MKFSGQTEFYSIVDQKDSTDIANFDKVTFSV